MTTTHTGLVITAGVIGNLAFAAMFIARVRDPGRARTYGLFGTSMALPLVVAALIAWAQEMEGWDVVLPLVFVAFAAIEILVDFILDFEVRESRWLWPYLMSFYLAQWSVIGVAFRVSEAGGAAVLVSYFICLAATAYSYRKVGHGTGRHGADKPSVSMV